MAECTIFLQWLVLSLPWLERPPSTHPQRNTDARETSEGLLYSVAVQGGGGVVASDDSRQGTEGSSGGGPLGITAERPGGAGRAGGQLPRIPIKSILKQVAKENILSAVQLRRTIFVTNLLHSREAAVVSQIIQRCKTVE